VVKRGFKRGGLFQVAKLNYKLKEVNIKYMRKRLVAIYSVLVVAIVLLSVFVPSCTGGTTGTIKVQATLCGTAWNGTVSYTLTTTGSASPVSGTSVPASHTVDAGNWTCAYADDGSGPAGAFLVDITPSATQTLSAGGTITFTLNFELDQDAAIEWLTWTVNGIPTELEYYEAVPCQIIDAHFKQWVDGCEGYNVTVNETSLLTISYLGGPAPVQIYVVNDDCALNKTPTNPQALPPVKKSQVTSFDGNPVVKGWLSDPIVPGMIPLDVETAWQLVKETDYTKSINWFGISKFVELPVVPHPCVLFELLLPVKGVYTFQLQASAMVALADDTDVNPDNNHDASSVLMLTVTVP
jgi:hypothetical protein